MSAQVKQFGRNHVSNSQTFFCRLRSTRLQYNHCLIFLLGDVTKGRYFPMTCVPIQELIRPENVWDSALFSGTFLLLVSGSRVFARKFRPVDFFEVTNFDPDVRRCMRCMRFLLLPYESHRKFMEIHGNYQRYIYSLGMPSPNRRRRATLFLGVAVLCAPALVFAYAGWTIRRWAEWGIWRLVTCDMVHQFL